jgi:flavorubredoxin
MEPDHSANVAVFAEAYPEATIVASAQAFAMMKNFFGTDYADRRLVVKEGDTLSTGRHVFTFVAAPMVHWPEVIVTYDSTDKVLFSADGFGKFGANDVEDPEGWDCEARRYYIGIVGKYGAQTQALLKKAAGLDIQTVCPLHGPILKGDAIAHAIEKYLIWSSYAVESEGVFIAYTSVYGNTKAAALLLKEELLKRGCPKVAIADLARDDMPEAVEDAFRYGKLVLATTTYNMGVFPFMHTFINHLTERSYRNRTIGVIENGTWAPMAAKTIKDMFAGSQGIAFAEPVVTVRSALDDASRAQIAALAEVLK